MPGNPDLQRRLGAVEELLHKIESAANPSLRADVQELVELVMSLHGAGMERMLDIIRMSDSGDAAVQKLGRDELVASLLVLHGLHPLSLADRLTQALDKVRLRLRPHEADIELLSLEVGAVRLKLHAKAQAHGCGSSAQSLKEIVEEGVLQAVPDLASLNIEGAQENEGFVPLEILMNKGTASLVLNGKGSL